MTKTHCGYVAIVGRPNVGKSTLLNALIGEKVSITCHKRQTTRHTILGVKTIGDSQILYIDTPGLHHDVKTALNRYMNRSALSSLHDVNVVLFVIDVERWTDEDEYVLRHVRESGKPVVLLVNKIDSLQDKNTLLPKLQELAAKCQFAAIIPVSALRKENLSGVENCIQAYLPEGPFYFPEDQITDRDASFQVAEIIREKLFQVSHQEVPYSSTVIVEKMAFEDKLLTIFATIYVEKAGQKAIIVGNKGSHIKMIGMRARQELEKKFACKVYLQLWVKVKDDWTNQENTLNTFGFES